MSRDKWFSNEELNNSFAILIWNREGSDVFSFGHMAIETGTEYLSMFPSEQKYPCKPKFNTQAEDEDIYHRFPDKYILIDTPLINELNEEIIKAKCIRELKWSLDCSGLFRSIMNRSYGKPLRDTIILSKVNGTSNCADICLYVLSLSNIIDVYYDKLFLSLPINTLYSNLGFFPLVPYIIYLCNTVQVYYVIFALIPSFMFVTFTESPTYNLNINKIFKCLIETVISSALIVPTILILNANTDSVVRTVAFVLLSLSGIISFIITWIIYALYNIIFATGISYVVPDNVSDNIISRINNISTDGNGTILLYNIRIKRMYGLLVTISNSIFSCMINTSIFIYSAPIIISIYLLFCILSIRTDIYCRNIIEANVVYRNNNIKLNTISNNIYNPIDVKHYISQNSIIFALYKGLSLISISFCLSMFPLGCDSQFYKYVWLLVLPMHVLMTILVVIVLGLFDCNYTRVLYENISSSVPYKQMKQLCRI